MLGLTAAEIGELAFSSAIQAGAGKITEGAIKKVKLLGQKIRDKFKEEPAAEKALVEVEEQHSPEILEQQVVPYLQVAMLKDTQFTQEIQNITQQINQEIDANTENQTNISAGDVNGGDNAIGFGNIHNRAGTIDLRRETQEKKS